MADTLKPKSLRKFVTRFRKLSFGGDTREETLEQHARFDPEGRMLSEVRTDDSGHSETHTYEYNTSGSLVVHHLVSEAAEAGETIRFDYDEKNRVVKRQKFYGDDPGEYTLYTYADHDQPTEVKSFDPDGEPESEETVTYNAKKLPIHHTRYLHESESTERSEITYNDRDNPERKTVTNDSNELVSVTEFHYDDKNQLVRLVESNARGKVVSEILSTYDERGNVTERAIRDFHPRVLRFEFDEADNCVEEAVFDEHGNLLHRSTYEFDAYNQPLTETHYHMDANQSAPSNTHTRYEYEMWSDAAS